MTDGLHWRRLAGDVLLFEKVKCLHNVFRTAGTKPSFTKGEIIPPLGKFKCSAEPCAVNAWCLDGMKRSLSEIQLDDEEEQMSLPKEGKWSTQLGLAGRLPFLKKAKLFQGARP